VSLVQRCLRVLERVGAMRRRLAERLLDQCPTSHETLARIRLEDQLSLGDAKMPEDSRPTGELRVWLAVEPRHRAVVVVSVLAVPDWVCEILSPTTRRHDVLRKQPYYARIGVPYLWLVDIEARVLTVHRLESSEWRIIGTYNDETEARIAPFDAVPLDVASWWPPAPPADQP
jgi:hypothetical protein